MKVIGIIPARFSATRFMGKVLADLGGKPVVQHVWENAKKARLLEDLIIATDDERVVKAAEDFGAKVVYTSPDQPSGTDRLIEVVNPIDVEIVVNIQGDEVLLRPEVIEAAVSALVSSDDISCGTACHKIESGDDFVNEDLVKVVLDKSGYALYFSRSPIPHFPSSNKSSAPRLGHIGVYAFKKDALLRFARMKPGVLERTESLEQLRLLEAGMKIKVNLTKFNNCSLNRKRDVPIIEKLLAAERE